MSDLHATFLADIRAGNLHAALVLADHLDEEQSHLAPLVRAYAEIIRASDSVCDVFTAVSAIIDIVEGGG